MSETALAKFDHLKARIAGADTLEEPAQRALTHVLQMSQDRARDHTGAREIYE